MMLANCPLCGVGMVQVDGTWLDTYDGLPHDPVGHTPREDLVKVFEGEARVVGDTFLVSPGSMSLVAEIDGEPLTSVRVYVRAEDESHHPVLQALVKARRLRVTVEVED
jgi:hypothetical protein